MHKQCVTNITNSIKPVEVFSQLLPLEDNFVILRLVEFNKLILEDVHIRYTTGTHSSSVK